MMPRLWIVDCGANGGLDFWWLRVEDFDRDFFYIFVDMTGRVSRGAIHRMWLVVLVTC
jgi:hypothetical protein